MEMEELQLVQVLQLEGDTGMVYLDDHLTRYVEKQYTTIYSSLSLLHILHYSV